jgi:hypothetical protein
MPTGQLFLVTAVAKVVTGWRPGRDRERLPPTTTALSLDPLRVSVRVVAGVGKGSLTRENDGCQAVTIPESEDTSSMPSSHVLLDQVEIAFDDERAVASAGLLLSAY